MRLNSRFLALALLSTPVSASGQQAPPKFDAYVQRVMETFTVPGLSVAIVKDGKVVLAKGYGVRRMGEPGAGGRARPGSASRRTPSCSPRPRWHCWWKRARSPGTSR